ncbi:MAG TPA: crossover junction endodeoxyribonuclease RuvC [Solibacterales bacterium]|nr:crossover junction endodeoxyribonuclease RuvC [Bryobacterales bacterium]
MRILGIDCGTERTGWGVIDTDGHAHKLLGAGVIRTDARQPLETRLCAIGAGLRRIAADFAPDAAVVEDLFHAANARSALKLAHVRGVALFTLAEAGLPVGAYSPAEIKLSVVGHGRAEKEQVQFMVRRLVGPAPELDAEDAADAVAAAICHATRVRLEQRVHSGVAL